LPDHRSLIADWLEACRDRLFSELAASNIYTALNEAFLDLVTVGTCNILSEEKPVTKRGFNGFSFQAVHIAEYVIDENAQGGVDTVLRRFKLTARQAMQMFGAAALPDTIRAAARPESKDQDREHDFLHAVFPRLNDAGEDLTTLRLGYMSLYVALEARTMVRQAGFAELPFHVARWTKATRERYGRSPAMLALPDIKTLNLIVRYGLEALPLALYPPWLVKEGSLSSGALKLSPGAQNHWDGSPDDKPTQMEWRGSVQIEVAKEQEYRARIGAAMHADRLRLKDSPQMTATEVLERREEFLRFVGPAAARIESELLSPLIERCFMLMLRAGALPPPPEELIGMEAIDVVFESPIARAAKLAHLKAYQDWWALNAPALQVNPGLLDNIDLDAAARDSAEILGLPAAYVRDARAVARLRLERQQAQAQAAALQTSLSVADTAATVVDKTGEEDASTLSSS
jgi:hypothetical protein